MSVSVLILTHQRRTALALWDAETGAENGRFTLIEPFVCLGVKDTAEDLANFYLKCLDAAGGWLDQDVSALYFCEGPGSFTGLRIGCSFLNGLCTGRPRSCFVVRDDASEAELMRRSVLPLQQDDLDRNLEFLRKGLFKEVVFFEPFYGREPGPVVKLRQTSTGA